MKAKVALRAISLAMLIVAVVFLSYALTHPEAGCAFYVFGIKIGSAIWRIFYLIYAAVMLSLFVISFFVKGKGRADHGQ